MTLLGLFLVVAGASSYVVLIFALHRFTYRTWLFDVAVGLGMLVAVSGWALGGSGWAAAGAVVLGVAWFLVTRVELRLRGSERLNVAPGDPFPSMTSTTVDGDEVTERDLAANAPALLVLYRGWWCPSHRAQLDELVRDYETLADAGLSVYAGSVDAPVEAAPLQERLGDRITVLCAVPTSVLDAIGVRDERGAPWYDRLLFGAAHRDISMPAALVIDDAGKVVFAYRSRRVDERARTPDILAAL